jgi:hypothetical protein
MLTIMNHCPSICVASADVLAVDYTMYIVDRELIVQSTPNMPMCVIVVFGYPLSYLSSAEFTQLWNLGALFHHVSWTSCPKLSSYLPPPPPTAAMTIPHEPSGLASGLWFSS